MILTDDKGRPIALRPCRKDYASDVEFIRAFHAYKDRITDAANRAFDDAFRKEMKS